MYNGFMMHRKRGFTLIELLVVIGIIGILSSIVLVSVNSARMKARDARRMSNLREIRTALYLYYEKKGNWIDTGSGCGSGGTGIGWFNYTGGAYTKSIVQCLLDEKVIGSEIIDPSGIRAGSSDVHTYMKYNHTYSGKIYVCIYANLEGVAPSRSGPCSTFTAYGMDYGVAVSVR